MPNKLSFHILNFLFFLIKFIYFHLYFQEISNFDLFLKTEIFFLILIALSYNFYFENVLKEISKLNTNLKDYNKFLSYLVVAFSPILYLTVIFLYIFFLFPNLKIFFSKEILFLLFINLFFIKYQFLNNKKNSLNHLIIFSAFNFLSIFLIIVLNEFKLLIIYYLFIILAISIFNKLKINKELKYLIIYKKIYSNIKSDLRYFFLIKKFFLSFIFSNSHYIIIITTYLILLLDNKKITHLIIMQIFFLDLPRIALKQKFFNFFYDIKHLTFNFIKFKENCKSSFFRNLIFFLKVIFIINLSYFLIDIFFLKIHFNYEYLFFNLVGFAVFLKGYLLSIIYSRLINTRIILKKLLLQNAIFIPLFIFSQFYFNLEDRLIMPVIVLYLYIDLYPLIKILKSQKIFQV